jgi:hypothetical protein
MLTLSTQVQPSRLQAVADFEDIMSAVPWHFLRSKLLRQDGQLLSLADLQPFLLPQRLYRGVQDIPVRQIVGSVGRRQDFSRRFHPLRKSMNARWINVRLLASNSGWPPIQVYQVGNLYFVEDGHHRVSVANYLGYQSIEAEVWEYPLKLSFVTTARLDEIIAQLKQQGDPARANPYHGTGKAHQNNHTHVYLHRLLAILEN